MQDETDASRVLVVNRPVHYIPKGQFTTPCGLHVTTPAVYTGKARYVTCDTPSADGYVGCKDMAEQDIQKEEAEC